MDDLKELIIEILNEIEKKDSNVVVAGGKGGPGKVYSDKTTSVLKNLGKEENEEPEDYILKPVEISKAFRGE